MYRKLPHSQSIEVMSVDDWGKRELAPVPRAIVELTVTVAGCLLAIAALAIIWTARHRRRVTSMSATWAHGASPRRSGSRRRYCSSSSAEASSLMLAAESAVRCPCYGCGHRPSRSGSAVFLPDRLAGPVHRWLPASGRGDLQLAGSYPYLRCRARLRGGLLRHPAEVVRASPSRARGSDAFHRCGRCPGRRNWRYPVAGQLRHRIWRRARAGNHDARHRLARSLRRRDRRASCDWPCGRRSGGGVRAAAEATGGAPYRRIRSSTRSASPTSTWISLSSRSIQRHSGSVPTGMKSACCSQTRSVRSAPSTYCCHQTCRR